MNMKKNEKLIRIRKEIEELKKMREQVILMAGYKSVEDYYQDLEQRKGKQNILVNNNISA